MSHRLARLWPRPASRLTHTSVFPLSCPTLEGLGILFPIPQQKVAFLTAKRFKWAALWAMTMALAVTVPEGRGGETGQGAECQTRKVARWNNDLESFWGGGRVERSRKLSGTEGCSDGSAPGPTGSQAYGFLSIVGNRLFRNLVSLRQPGFHLI